ncbi:MAG: preprotein translocase subunit SecE, partial [Candidatus Micrarchaeaceae archaeon]
VVGLIIAPPFLRSSWRELKLVTWPGWKLSRQLTIAVIIFALVFAVLVGLVDWGFNAAFKELFLR